MYCIGIFLWTIYASVTLGAETAPLSSATAQTDLSIHYLGKIFGLMDGLLHGSGSQVLGNLSQAFNNILLIMLGVVWGYIAFVGILQTASDGQFLGQQGGSTWLPLRMVAGMCALVPNATTGYSIIQTLVMYLVIQGINFANLIHNTSLQYLERGGTIVEMSPAFAVKDLQAQEDYQDLIATVGHVLKLQVQVLVLYKAMLAQKKTLHWDAAPNFSYMLRFQETTAGMSYMHFPSIEPKYYGKWQHLEGICGKLTWENSPWMNINVQLMVRNLLPLAEQIANGIMRQPQETTKAPPNPVSTSGSSEQPELSIRMTKQGSESEFSETSSFNDLLDSGKYDLPQRRLVDITNDFISLAKSHWRQQALEEDIAQKKELNQLTAKITQGGWITAGSYYYQLAQYNRKINDLDQGSLYHKRPHIHGASDKALLSQLEAGAQYEALKSCLQEIDRYIEQETQYAQALAASTTSEGLDLSQADATRLYGEESLLKPLTKNIQFLQQHFDATLKSQLDPITSLSRMGHAVMGAVEKVWTQKNDKVWETLWRTNELEPVKRGVFAPLILIWMTFNFTIGATLSYYIPLLPFLFYFFGSLTWLIQVMEIVFIGGPLACVGLAHPQGQGFMGKAGQAMMLIIHVMLRPVLMVLGLIAGMILSTIAFALFNQGYLIAIKVIGQLDGELLNIISHTAMMTIYTTVSYSIVARTFSLINDLPNKALRSMEGLTDSNNEAEPAMQVKSSIDQYAGNASQHILGKKGE